VVALGHGRKNCLGRNRRKLSEVMVMFENLTGYDYYTLSKLTETLRLDCISVKKNKNNVSEKRFSGQSQNKLGLSYITNHLQYLESLK
jgi:hypothetical protein